MKNLSFLLIAAFATLGAHAQTTIAAKDAAKHIGENVTTICDKVYGTKFLEQAQITFLDIGGKHPDEALSVVIKGADRKKFKDAPEDLFKDKNVCVTGTVIDYKGKPEIVVTDPAQIKISQP